MDENNLIPVYSFNKIVCWMLVDKDSSSVFQSLKWRFLHQSHRKGVRIRAKVSGGDISPGQLSYILHFYKEELSPFELSNLSKNLYPVKQLNSGEIVPHVYDFTFENLECSGFIEEL